MELKICGTEYTLLWCDDLEEEGEECDGLINYSNKTISIKLGLSKENEEKALYHELGHGVLHELGIDRLVSEDLNEMIVENIGNDE